jgi:Kdo2-lipid IVA lauroyltransferase/acyltransferase
MKQKEQTGSGLCFDTYPAPLDIVTAYTREHSIDEDVSGHYGIRIFLKLLLWFAQCLSWKAAYRVGRGIGLLLYHVRLRRKIAMVNLDIVFGDSKSHTEKMQIYKTSLINCGQVIINYLRIPFMGESFWRDHVSWQGEDILREVMNRKKGALLIAGHFGMMDLAGGKLGMSGYPVAVVGKRIKNSAINRFVIETRNAMNLGTIAHRKSMQRILEGIQRGEAVAMALDQNMKSRQGIFIDWMGRKASSVRSGAYVVKRTGAPVMAGYLIQKSADRFDFVVTEEVLWEACPDDPDKELLINTQHQSDAIQKIIYTRPELWFWIHRRWKRQPEGTQSPYDK